MGRKISFLTIGFIFICTAFFLNGWSGALAQTYVLKHGHGAAIQEEDQHASLVFKDFVETQSKGRIKVEIYPAAQLGNFREMVEGTSLGTQEMVATVVAGAANLLPEIQVTDIPYMFPDDRVAEKVYDGWFTEKLRDFALSKVPNLRLMVVTNGGGWRCFVNKTRQIRTPSDLKGLKLRTIESPLHVNLVKAMGGSPTPIPWQETYTAIRTGIAEGSMNAITDIVAVKLHEVMKHITLDYHMYMGVFVWMNNNFYKSLPDDLKRIVLDGLYHYKWVARDHVKRQQIDDYETFKKAGGNIYVPTPAEKAQFIEAGKSAKEWFIEKYGREWVDTLEKAVAEASAEVEKERKKEM